MKDRWSSVWIVAVVAAGLLVLLSVAAIGARHIPSGSGDALLPFDGQTMLRIVVDIGALLLIAGVVWLVVPGKTTRRKRREVKRTPWFTTVLVLTVMLFVFMQLGKLTKNVEPAEETTIALPEANAPTPIPASSPWNRAAGSPDILLLVVGGVVVAAGVIAAIRRQSDGEAAERPIEAAAVVGVIDDLLAELERSPDPRYVVISAYGRMEEALAHDGVARKRSEAPLEYLQRALDRLHVSSRSVTRLTDLFTEARFSPHEIDEEMAAAAKAALSDVRDELGALK
jgi:hypothetical protein